ncbi:MAG: hypothetical protein HY925_07365, partial [Elusimicrobia bacterium]|nr:hypothetical protein [Elusimicrobiota bacterium]
MNEHEWERKLDQKLKALPERKAPGALLSKVMAEAKARETAKAGLGWLGTLALVLAAGAALWVLKLEAGAAVGAASRMLAPWAPVGKGMLRVLELVGRTAGAA